MSSSRRRFAGATPSRREVVAGVGAGLAAAALAGCGFQPLYGTTASGERLKDVMAGVQISSVPGRVGQRVRNELIFGTARGGYPAEPNFRLEIAIRESLLDQLVNRTGDAQGQIYVLEADFRLIRVADETIALQGRATSRAAYDRFEQNFANVRAKIDAENRAATTIADNIKVRLAAFLSAAA